MNLPVGTLVLRRKQLQASKRERAIVAVVGILLLIASLIFLFLGAKDWFAFTKELLARDRSFEADFPGNRVHPRALGRPARALVQAPVKRA
jgi:hypothetical protein